MATKRIASSEGLTITIEGESGDLDGQELQTAAILALIENADTHHWEKQDLDAPHTFFAAVLRAVTQHYWLEDPVSRARPVYALLQDLIQDLRSNGHLQEIIETGDTSDE